MNRPGRGPGRRAGQRNRVFAQSRGWSSSSPGGVAAAVAVAWRGSDDRLGHSFGSNPFISLGQQLEILECLRLFLEHWNWLEHCCRGWFGLCGEQDKDINTRAAVHSSIPPSRFLLSGPRTPQHFKLWQIFTPFSVTQQPPYELRSDSFPELGLRLRDLDKVFFYY